MFAPWWTERFGDVPPLGYVLRSTFPDRWVRFHSLPESKRYAETADAREGLLQRQYAVADCVLGAGVNCYIVVPTYGDAELGSADDVTEFPSTKFVCELRTEQDDALTSFFVAEADWDPAAVRKALIAIADDQLRALWVEVATGQVFAPYDGGVDCILASSGRRDSLKAKYAGWLSERADGL